MVQIRIKTAPVKKLKEFSTIVYSWWKILLLNIVGKNGESGLKKCHDKLVWEVVGVKSSNLEKA